MTERFEAEPLDVEWGEQLRELVARQERRDDVLAGVRNDIGSLDDDLTEVREAVAGLHRDLGAVASEVRDVAQAVGDVASVLNQLGARFDEFAERYAQDQVRAQAEAELTRLTLEWQSRFAKRRHTRALAHGLVHTLVRDALEHGVVEGAVVEACTGETMLADASYWLAPAVVALAADYLGEAQRARRARSIAYSLDPAKTDLFFALTCSRLGRFTEAARWMDRYLHSIDPDALDEDFQIVLDAVACKELGDEAHAYAEHAMARWAGQFALAKGADAGDHDPVARHVWDLRHRLDDAAFEELGTLCREAEWAHLRKGWELASVPSAVLEHLNEQFPDDPSPWSGTGPHTEGALGALIARFDTDEQALDHRMEQLRRVIAHDGDVRAAQADLDADSDVRRPSDLRTLLVNAVFVPQSVRLGDEARRLVLANLWPRVLDAAQECAGRSAHLLPGQLTLVTGEWRGVVPTDPATPVDAEPLAADLAGTIDERTDRRVAAVRRRPVRLWGAILLTVVAGLLGILTPSGPTRVALGCVAVACALWASYEWRRVPSRRDQLRTEGRALARRSVRSLRRGLVEREEFFSGWVTHLQASGSLAAWGADTWGAEKAAASPEDER